MALRARPPIALALTCAGALLLCLALPGCRSDRRVAAPRPSAPACLPPLEAPRPVGTPVGESMTEDFVLRVHDARDVLDLMPVIQLVGPGHVETVPPEDALVEALLQELPSEDRPQVQLRVTDTGAVLVRGPERVQERIAEALHGYRTDLVRQQAKRTAWPVVPSAAPRDGSPTAPQDESPPAPPPSR